MTDQESPDQVSRRAESHLESVFTEFVEFVTCSAHHASMADDPRFAALAAAVHDSATEFDAKFESLEHARLREANAAAIRDITSSLLSGMDEEEALDLIAERSRRVIRADVAVLVLPSVGQTWAIEFAHGDGADSLIGTTMPPEGRALSSLKAGAGLIVADLSTEPTMRVPALRRFGAGLYAPLLTEGAQVGVLLLLRNSKREPFAPIDLELAESFASQAAVALVVASAREVGENSQVLAERQRIARDLHDFAIQQLFAVGMQLENLRKQTSGMPRVGPAVSKSISSTLATVDSTVAQIRSIVHSLRDESPRPPLLERIRHEITLAAMGLGYSPTARLEPEAIELLESAELSDDVVAVIREGLSNVVRHAHATAASVAITPVYRTEPTVMVNVSDNGEGIPRSPDRLSGLKNLEARARQYAGYFEAIRTEPGTMLTWQVEVPQAPRH